MDGKDNLPSGVGFKRMDYEVRWTWFQILTLSLISCLILDELLNLCEPQFFYLENGDN